MGYLILKALLSGVIIMAVSETAKRSASWGTLIASLPLVSVLSMLWLWQETHDRERMADHTHATFWMVLPSLPIFLLFPLLLRRGMDFYPALAVACAITVVLYFLMTWLLRLFGVELL